MPCEFKNSIGEISRSIDSSGELREIAIVHKCQFDHVKESELYEFDDKQWCEYHLPLMSESGQASEKHHWSAEQKKSFNEKILQLLDKPLKSDKPSQSNLRGVIFPSKIDIESQNLHEIILDEAVFHEDATFKNVKFISYCSFKGSVFNKVARFMSCEFEERSNFSDAQFNDQSFFNRSSFKAGVIFSCARFERSAAFIDVDFKGITSFKNSHFNELAHFESKNDSGFYWVDFSEATFNIKANFLNRKFSGITNFSGCNFGRFAPEFHNCEFHQDTSFRRACFSDVKSDSAPRAYRTLKLAMEKVRARDEHARFYALEQKSIQHQPETPIWVKVVSTLYEIISDYGQSALRPLGYLIGTSFIFFIIYFNVFFSDANAFSESIGFTVVQIVRPFNVWLKEISHASIGLKVLASIQSMLSLTFITLFILAVRWRFTKG